MFNENKITHNFAVLSDIHISGIWGMENREAHFKNVIKFCKEQASGRLDAFLMNGDFTDAMNSVPNVVINEAGFSRDFEEAKAIQTANEFRILRSCLATIDEDTDIVYTLGNHDGCNNNNIERFITEFSSRDEIGDNKNFERMYRTDLDLDSMRNGVRHCVVGGYHILALDMFTDYTEPVAKIKSWLDEITAAET
ncbi:MAG: metallophosphoesterase, partial [Clostridia bacterium]|nr:metallophosphoesterase [Clostridia bacterium]